MGPLASEPFFQIHFQSLSIIKIVTYTKQGFLPPGAAHLVHMVQYKSPITITSRVEHWTREAILLCQRITLEVHTVAYVREVRIVASENWDEDFEYQQDSGKTGPPPQRRRHAVVSDARKLSIASIAALEDWDAESTPRPMILALLRLLRLFYTDTSNIKQTTGTMTLRTVGTSPKKVIHTSPKDRKEENWDDNMAPGEETEDDSAELGFTKEPCNIIRAKMLVGDSLSESL